MVKEQEMIQETESEPISIFPNQGITLAVAWKSKNCVFGGSNNALTSIHSPRKGERRLGLSVGIVESYSVTIVTYLSN